MSDRPKAAVMASFAGDSLALGAHWIYNTRKIADMFGRADALLKPLEGSYHPTKGKGDFTHYGDQTVVLLESIAACGRFDLQDFSKRWRALFVGYTGYVDQATRTTLSQYAAGRTWKDVGSPSNDLAGAARIAPLVYLYREDLEALVKASRDQTRMTHGDPMSIDSAEFFARVTFETLKGADPVAAIEMVARDAFSGSKINGWVREGLESAGADSVSAIARFGQSCHTPEAFPGVIHLLARYADNLEEALVQAVMAGGDNAARAMLAGMVLGGRLGLKAIPEGWVSALRRREHILDLLATVG